MELCLAQTSDIPQVQLLMKKYQISSVNEEDKKDGFVTTLLSDGQLTQLIEQERGLFVAKMNGNVVAFIMAASWHYWRIWPLFEYMIGQLSHYTFVGKTLDTGNSYQYGPICIDKSVRGSGVLNS